MATVSDFRSDLASLVKASDAVVSTFQMIERQTHFINGGVGNLRPALEELQIRTDQEKAKRDHLKNLQKQADQFVEHTIATDKKVKDLVTQNQEEFYHVNPWARPAPPQREREQNCVQKAWNWITTRFSDATNAIKNTVQNIGDRVTNFKNRLTDTIHLGIHNIKNWCRAKCNAITQFCIDHKDAIRNTLAGVTVVSLLALSCVAPEIFLMPFLMSVTNSIINVGGKVVKNAMEGKTGKNLMDDTSSEFLSGSLSGAICGFIPGIDQIGKAAYLLNFAFSAVSNHVTGVINEFLNDGDVSQEDRKKINIDSFFSGISGIFGTSKTSHNIPKNIMEFFKNKKLISDISKDAIKDGINGKMTEELVNNVGNNSIQLWRENPSALAKKLLEFHFNPMKVIITDELRIIQNMVMQ